MRATAFLVLALSFGLVDSRASDRSGKQAWLTYTGAWFKVEYPQGFSPVPLARSSTSTNGYDGVKFVAKNEGVELYLYSPQWSGQEADYTKEITANPATETLNRDTTLIEDYVVDNKAVETNAITTRFISIVAKNSSYKREYEITEDHVQSSRLIFGFRFPDESTYETWKSAYDRFRHSLVRYAD